MGSLVSHPIISESLLYTRIPVKLSPPQTLNIDFTGTDICLDSSLQDSSPSLSYSGSGTYCLFLSETVCGFGKISPRCYLAPESKRSGRTPFNAVSFVYAYALNGVDSIVDDLPGLLTEPIFKFAYMGGFVYLDSSDNISGIYALDVLPPTVNTEGCDMIDVRSPYVYRDSTKISKLYSTKRFHTVTIKELRKKGAQQYCWILPGEIIKDSKDFVPYGGFLYQCDNSFILLRFKLSEAEIRETPNMMFRSTQSSRKLIDSANHSFNTPLRDSTSNISRSKLIIIRPKGTSITPILSNLERGLAKNIIKIKKSEYAIFEVQPEGVMLSNYKYFLSSKNCVYLFIVDVTLPIEIQLNRWFDLLRNQLPVSESNYESESSSSPNNDDPKSPNKPVYIDNIKSDPPPPGYIPTTPKINTTLPRHNKHKRPADVPPILDLNHPKSHMFRSPRNTTKQSPGGPPSPKYIPKPPGVGNTSEKPDEDDDPDNSSSSLAFESASSTFESSLAPDDKKDRATKKHSRSLIKKMNNNESHQKKNKESEEPLSSTVSLKYRRENSDVSKKNKATRSITIETDHKKYRKSMEPGTLVINEEQPQTIGDSSQKSLKSSISQDSIPETIQHKSPKPEKDNLIHIPKTARERPHSARINEDFMKSPKGDKPGSPKTARQYTPKHNDSKQDSSKVITIDKIGNVITNSDWVVIIYQINTELLKNKEEKKKINEKISSLTKKFQMPTMIKSGLPVIRHSIPEIRNDLISIGSSVGFQRFPKLYQVVELIIENIVLEKKAPLFTQSKVLYQIFLTEFQKLEYKKYKKLIEDPIDAGTWTHILITLDQVGLIMYFEKLDVVCLDQNILSQLINVFLSTEGSNAIISTKEAATKINSISQLHDYPESLCYRILKSLEYLELCYELTNDEEKYYQQSGFLFPGLRPVADLLVLPLMPNDHKTRVLRKDPKSKLSPIGNIVKVSNVGVNTIPPLFQSIILDEQSSPHPSEPKEVSNIRKSALKLSIKNINPDVVNVKIDKQYIQDCYGNNLLMNEEVQNNFTEENEIKFMAVMISLKGSPMGISRDLFTQLQIMTRLVHDNRYKLYKNGMILKDFYGNLQLWVHQDDNINVTVRGYCPEMWKECLLQSLNLIGINSLIEIRPFCPACVQTGTYIPLEGTHTKEACNLGHYIDRIHLQKGFPIDKKILSSNPLWSPKRSQFLDVEVGKWYHLDGLSWTELNKDETQISRKEEYNRVHDIFYNFVGKDRNFTYLMKNVLFFHNKILEEKFEKFYEKLLSQSMQKDDLTHRKYEDEEPVTPDIKEWRSWILQQHAKYVSRVSGNEGINLIAGFHGSSEEACLSIAKNNFYEPHEIVKQTDPGYFGKGIYFTQYPSYGSEYAKAQCLLVCWILMGKPYPVTESPDLTNPNRLLGKGLKPGYNSHYVIVKRVTPTVYLPCKPDENPDYDEVVVFSKDQILPRYLIYYDRKSGDSEIKNVDMVILWFSDLLIGKNLHIYHWFGSNIPKLLVIHHRTITELEIWLKNNEEYLSKVKVVGFFPEGSAKMNIVKDLNQILNTTHVWMKLPRLIFFPITNIHMDHLTTDYNQLIDFCTPQTNGIIFDKNTFFTMMARKDPENLKQSKLKILHFSLLKVEIFSEEQRKKKSVHCEFGFINDQGFIDNLKHKTKKKDSHVILTEDDNNTFNYYYYDEPSSQFKIEVWGKREKLGDVAFESLSSFLFMGENLAYTFELTHLTKSKLKCFVRVQWNVEHI